MYRDSVGNTYERLPKAPPVHTAKAAFSSFVGKKGRNARKCEHYRTRIGKPLGPGVKGNKAGKNKVGS